MNLKFIFIIFLLIILIHLQHLSPSADPAGLSKQESSFDVQSEFVSSTIHLFVSEYFFPYRLLCYNNEDSKMFSLGPQSILIQPCLRHQVLIAPNVKNTTHPCAMHSPCAMQVAYRAFVLNTCVVCAKPTNSSLTNFIRCYQS